MQPSRHNSNQFGRYSPEHDLFDSIMAKMPEKDPNDAMLAQL